tara:strand:- start:375 stop:569 length:195 start_codon:yes stop_codon:yes gene_type:complete
MGILMDNSRTTLGFSWASILDGFSLWTGPGSCTQVSTGSIPEFFTGEKTPKHIEFFSFINPSTG